MAGVHLKGRRTLLLRTRAGVSALRHAATLRASEARTYSLLQNRRRQRQTSSCPTKFLSESSLLANVGQKSLVDNCR